MESCHVEQSIFPKHLKHKVQKSNLFNKRRITVHGLAPRRLVKQRRLKANSKKRGCHNSAGVKGRSPSSRVGLLKNEGEEGNALQEEKIGSKGRKNNRGPTVRKKMGEGQGLLLEHLLRNSLPPAVRWASPSHQIIADSHYVMEIQWITRRCNRIVLMG